MKTPDSLANKKAILEYWTLVEFFSPYILKNVLNPQHKQQRVFADKLYAEPLPWLDAPLIEEEDQNTPFTIGYNLYLGLFNTEETADRARHVFTKSPSQWQSLNWRKTSLADSETCFARLTVTTHGIPLLGSLSLSTVPWADGRLLLENEKSLTIEQYWKSVNRLMQILNEELLPILPTRLVKKPKTQSKYLDGNSLLKISELLFEWAGYRPVDYPIVLIESLKNDESSAAKAHQFSTKRDVPILNSFYIQDLESASISLATQKDRPIDHYLESFHEKRILLESEEGKQAILHTLMPNKITSGRWPDPLTQHQSLMQQFAINAMFDTLKNKDIFSVNGPPGTGKTSLLREIIAENIVARAEAFSKFNSAKEAFVGKQVLNFVFEDPVFVSELHPSILGFEMLVASSNNTAVQNLSKELPLRASLDPSFQGASYLESVASKALGLEKGIAWGLISATLGNSDNCRRFVKNVFYDKNDVVGQLQIWEWIDNYDGPSFSDAKDAFIAVKERQERLFDELENFAFLHSQVGHQTVTSYCDKHQEALRIVEDELELLNHQLSKLCQDENENKDLLKLFQERNELWKDEKPHFLAKIVNPKAFQAWTLKLRHYRTEHLAVLEELKSCKDKQSILRELLSSTTEIANHKSEELLNSALLFYAYQDAYEELKLRHPTAKLPADSIEEDVAHFQSYYLTEEINAVRSELFVAAMTLHEAWLAETCVRKGGFRGNLKAISLILEGKIPTTTDDTRLAWQSVFLMIPVISSTFASIGRLFRYLEPGMLGWLLIDEAGQALPQAAVGAIWRAKKVLSIGDPFQIEPICSIPSAVIDGMAKSYLQDNTLSWAPSQISVQTLMDRASVFGTQRIIQEENCWLGSPLRVHRRCLEPMFTIANTIAYQNNMLYATHLNDPISLPSSCWWDVCGVASHQHYVAEQGKTLLQLLNQVLKMMDSPNLYVISPFREIISRIKNLLKESDEFCKLFKDKFPTTPLSNWIEQSIGTVHTFQGKQASAVFFVLGADKSMLGAIKWVTRRPNLLNVAVTRARSRFYIIGDYDLWKNWPYFEVAAKQLKRCK